MNKNIQYANHPRFWETHKEIWIQEYDKLDYEHRALCMNEPNGWFAEKQNDRVVTKVKGILNIKDDKE
jgi:hypothetical protein